MCVSDMIGFRKQLMPVYRNLKGIAEFQTIEGQLYFRIELDRLGHVQASGYLIDDLAGDNKLSFKTHFDQTQLRHTISEIDVALSELSQKTA